MSVTSTSLFRFDDSFVRELPELSMPWKGAGAADPTLLVLNEALALELGADPAALRAPDGLDVLVGRVAPEGTTPVAMGYAGHQFGGFSPRLGDGRALLVGEIVDPAGVRHDLHLKGSGRTPFARGGDGRAAVGPMLREHLVSEAMHALGIPTTRSLAVVATGEQVQRETVLPGAVLARVAASHLRVGTFQYASRLEDRSILRRLIDHAVTRHHPHAAEAENPALALFEAVVEAQAALVAQWMLVGFVHGVMNTDNVAISGETIDYGPCAFMDAHDPGTVFSSIDEGARYAYGNQPHIAQWNLARLAEALLPAVDDDQPTAISGLTRVLETFPVRYAEHWSRGMRAKVGLQGAPGDDALLDDLLTLMYEQGADHTAFLRSLAAAVRGDDTASRSLLTDPAAFDAWATRWRADLAAEGRDPAAVADGMDAVNPVYVPRNHLVEEALAAATVGDLGPFGRLLDVLARPFEARSGLEAYALPAPSGFGPGYRTFCGT
ncbi:YdiU family protein [Patulibacter sp.]|uniref:protein adenylyltransferase SelO n=1 Tax=Patulibacter sp. TaxID=1912859 RepID=UPI002727F99E|nr:YdiU family protein [Patulibacter sp.]MDO9407533.1 YdiU family protein [Patulibacter sp.]